MTIDWILFALVVCLIFVLVIGLCTLAFIVAGIAKTLQNINADTNSINHNTRKTKDARHGN